MPSYKFIRKDKDEKNLVGGIAFYINDLLPSRIIKI